jgi:hypothetical protein
MVLGSTQPLVKMSTRNIPGGKGGRCLRLTSPTSCAEYHEIWEPNPPGTLWATPGLLGDSFLSKKRFTVNILFLAKRSRLVRCKWGDHLLGIILWGFKSLGGITWCRWVSGFGRFEVPYCFCVQDQAACSLKCLILKMKTLRSFEKSETSCPTTRRHTPRKYDSSPPPRW